MSGKRGKRGKRGKKEKEENPILWFINIITVNKSGGGGGGKAGERGWCSLITASVFDGIWSSILQAWQKYCGQKPTFQGVFWNISLSPLSPTINAVVQMMSDI